MWVRFLVLLRLVFGPSACSESSPAANGSPPDGGAVNSDAGAGDSGAGAGWPTQARWTLAAQRPGRRSGHLLVANDQDGSLLFLSGSEGAAPIGDFWKFHQGSWSRLTPIPGEAAERKNGAGVWDSLRQRLLIQGGTWSGHKNGVYTVSVLGDAWAWDGATWTELPSTPGPGERGGQAAAFDSARDRFVVFGGSRNQGPLGDHWELDGNGWQPIQPADGVLPPPRINARMVYDTKRKVAVLFGGQQVAASGGAIALDDTWEWNGTSWTERQSALRPVGRGHHSMSYDAKRGVTWMHGGSPDFSPIKTVYDDLWSWDGSQWQKHEGASPPPRSHAAMAYDAGRDRLVLVGGGDSKEVLADTWERDEHGWSETTLLPPPRSNAAVAVSDQGTSVLLFGGYQTLGGRYFADSWLRQDDHWRRSGLGPSARAGARMAWHDQAAVLFGGNAAGTVLGDTWLWQDGQWQQLSPAGQQPPSRTRHALAYDPKRGRSVMFGGGSSSGVLNDTWEWDGTQWQLVASASPPPARTGHQLLYDAVAQRVLLLGGIDGQDQPLSDAWAFDGQAWQPVTGTVAGPAHAAWSMGPSGSLLSFGGYDGQGMTADTQLATPEGTRLLSVHDMSPPARAGAILVPQSDGWLMFAGYETDFDSQWTDLSDSWRLELLP